MQDEDEEEEDDDEEEEDDDDEEEEDEEEEEEKADEQNLKKMETQRSQGKVRLLRAWPNTLLYQSTALGLTFDLCSYSLSR